jgi:hypothetical protein
LPLISPALAGLSFVASRSSRDPEKSLERGNADAAFSHDRRRVDGPYPPLAVSGRTGARPRPFSGAFCRLATGASFGSRQLYTDQNQVLVCYEIERMVVGGSETKLVLNQPPRTLKSYMVSVCLPAWVLGCNPGARILCAFNVVKHLRLRRWTGQRHPMGRGFG